MKIKTFYIIGSILLLGVIYLVGPQPQKPEYRESMPVVPQTFQELERYVIDRESKHKIKPNNEARIIWADSTKKKTPYSVVYLHGFSASHEEGNPVHLNFAKKFGCNLYLSRLADHGIDTTEQLLYFTPDRWWETCKEALAIGKVLGDKVILMSTSTGGTAALMLAAKYPKDVYAIINMSPNIKLFHPLAPLANNPWGLQLAQLISGGKYQVAQPTTAGADFALKAKYWNDRYRLEAVSQLQQLLEDKMNEKTFTEIICPSLSLYYFKNEAAQDSTVKVSAILEMHEALSTPPIKKQVIAVPQAGSHILGSYISSKDIPFVEQAIEQFAAKELLMKKQHE